MSNWDRAIKRIKKNTADEVNRLAIDTQAKLKLKLSQPGTGRKYKRPTRVHTASKPGEPPAVDTGNLRRSMQVDSSMVPVKLTARVGSNVRYGYLLEFGTRRVAPRPYMRPVTSQMKKQVGKRFSAKRLLRGVKS